MQPPHRPDNHPAESSTHFYQLAWVRYVSLFMIVFILVGFWLYSETLISSIEALRSELNQTRTALAHQQEIVNILSSLELRVYLLQGTNPQHSGTVFFDRSTGAAALKTSSLPPTNKGNLYQTWALVRRHPIAAGSFSKDSMAADPFWITITPDSVLRAANGFLVSLESDSHASQPSPKILLTTVVAGR